MKIPNLKNRMVQFGVGRSDSDWPFMRAISVRRKECVSAGGRVRRGGV